MRTVFLGERPPELEAFLVRRRALGQDRYDEVWEGSYHVAPPGPHPFHGIVDNELGVVLHPYAKRQGLIGCSTFNLGTPENYRVPDRGYVDDVGPGAFLPTAKVVVEILSPDDESYEKFAFYAAQGVQEVLVAHPTERWVRCYDLQQGPPLLVERSECLDVSMATLEAEIAWPGG